MLKRLAVIGSRDFNDKGRVFKLLDKNYHKIKMIVSGGARGADTLAKDWAQERGFPCLICFARWRSLSGEYDNGAGFRRNRQIIENCDTVLAFWKNKSKGTANSIKIAQQLGKKVHIIEI